MVGADGREAVWIEFGGALQQPIAQRRVGGPEPEPAGLPGWYLWTRSSLPSELTMNALRMTATALLFAAAATSATATDFNASPDLSVLPKGWIQSSPLIPMLGEHYDNAKLGTVPHAGAYRLKGKIICTDYLMTPADFTVRGRSGQRMVAPAHLLMSVVFGVALTGRGRLFCGSRTSGGTAARGRGATFGAALVGRGVTCVFAPS